MTPRDAVIPVGTDDNRQLRFWIIYHRTWKIRNRECYQKETHFFEVCFTGISWMFLGGFKDASRMLQG